MLHDVYHFLFERLSISYFLFYQKNRFERLNSLGHHPGDPSDTYVGSSAATTVVRKTYHPLTSAGKFFQRLSNTSDGASRPTCIEQNHKILANEHALEQQNRASIKKILAKHDATPFRNHATKQPILITSSDVESVAMKQFHLGSTLS